MNRIKAPVNQSSAPNGQNDEWAKIVVKTTAGNPTGKDKLMCINTAVHTLSIYADGDWRIIATWISGGSVSTLSFGVSEIDWG